MPTSEHRENETSAKIIATPIDPRPCFLRFASKAGQWGVLLGALVGILGILSGAASIIIWPRKEPNPSPAVKTASTITGWFAIACIAFATLSIYLGKILERYDENNRGKYLTFSPKKNSANPHTHSEGISEVLIHNAYISP